MRELARILSEYGFGVTLNAQGNTFIVSPREKKIPLIFNPLADDLIHAAKKTGFSTSFSRGGKNILFKHASGLKINAAIKGARERVPALLFEAPSHAVLPEDLRNHLIAFMRASFDSPALRLERELKSTGATVSLMQTGALKARPAGSSATFERVFNRLGELPSVELLRKKGEIEAIDKLAEGKKPKPLLSAEFDESGHLLNVTLNNAEDRESSLAVVLRKILSPHGSTPSTGIAREAAKKGL